MLVEIVRPGTGDPVAPGEVGEVVVTTLFNTDYPLIRFGTGDLSAVLPGTSPVRPHQHAHQGLDGPRRPDDQGEGHVRASGAGRRDRASAIRRSCRRGSSSTTPTAHDRMTLQRRGRPATASSHAEAIVASIRDVTKLRGEVAFRAPGELPNDGKVIDDVRKYD